MVDVNRALDLIAVVGIAAVTVASGELLLGLIAALLLRIVSLLVDIRNAIERLPAGRSSGESSVQS
ncbi:hypothetical protein [Halomicrobium salinisoli]|uniref:hypothetical protein n=1 Tax=Halomicrobium salinisoli TaxID=2878391 RepID=UPI001CF026E0|nr:hypothetical protein [Halomicrobium salinisoli]